MGSGSSHEHMFEWREERGDIWQKQHKTGQRWPRPVHSDTRAHEDRCIADWARARYMNGTRDDSNVYNLHTGHMPRMYTAGPVFFKRRR